MQFTPSGESWEGACLRKEWGRSESSTPDPGGIPRSLLGPDGSESHAESFGVSRSCVVFLLIPDPLDSLLFVAAKNTAESHTEAQRHRELLAFLCGLCAS